MERIEDRMKRNMRENSSIHPSSVGNKGWLLGGVFLTQLI